MAVLKIEGLHRDVLRNRSFVTVVWKDDPEKRLGLPVPFDCQLDDPESGNQKSRGGSRNELESATVEGP
jgi:hypothetical protein